MPSLLSSPERLIEPSSVDLFKRVFAQHGALSRHEVSGSAATSFTQEERLAVVPLVFGLMPARALDRRHYTRPLPLKPLIRTHLQGLGVRHDDPDLLDILQNVIY